MHKCVSPWVLKVFGGTFPGTDFTTNRETFYVWRRQLTLCLDCIFPTVLSSVHFFLSFFSILSFLRLIHGSLRGCVTFYSLLFLFRWSWLDSAKGNNKRPSKSLVVGIQFSHCWCLFWKFNLVYLIFSSICVKTPCFALPRVSVNWDSDSVGSNSGFWGSSTGGSRFIRTTKSKKKMFKWPNFE